MFTYNRVAKDIKNEVVRRREITVEFINELGHTKEQMLSFSFLETPEVIKKAFNAFLDELNLVPPAITDITLPTVVDTTPTQAELDRELWLKNYRKWVEVKTKVIDTGIIPANHPKAVALLNNLKATIKEEYIDYI